MITRMTKMIKMNEVIKVTILIALTNLGTRRSGKVCQRTLMSKMSKVIKMTKVVRP